MMQTSFLKHELSYTTRLARAAELSSNYNEQYSLKKKHENI